jgi:hypothetical protein
MMSHGAGKANPLIDKPLFLPELNAGWLRGSRKDAKLRFLEIILFPPQNHLPRTCVILAVNVCMLDKLGRYSCGCDNSSRRILSLYIVVCQHRFPCVIFGFKQRGLSCYCILVSRSLDQLYGLCVQSLVQNYFLSFQLSLM